MGEILAGMALHTDPVDVARAAANLVRASVG